jgi:iron complex transport system substrate-binding protein
LEERLVGVSNYCDYPTAARNLPQCGTANLPDMDEIRRLEPHLLLTQSQLAEEDLIALQQMNVDVVMIPRAASVAQFKESYIALATLFEGQYTGADMGRDFVRNIQDRLDYLEGYLIPYAEDNGVKDALFLRLLDFNVATGDTLENELMTLIGLNNIAAGETDWLYDGEKANGTGRADFEAIDVIYMDEDFVNIKMLEQSAFYKGLQATLKDWYLYIDSIAFERQGLRMLDELEKMAAYAYPDVVPPLPGAAADPQTDDGGEDETDGSEDDTE